MSTEDRVSQRVAARQQERPVPPQEVAESELDARTPWPVRAGFRPEAGVEQAGSVGGRGCLVVAVAVGDEGPPQGLAEALEVAVHVGERRRAAAGGGTVTVTVTAAVVPTGLCTKRKQFKSPRARIALVKFT
ncbi:hypothetical protein PG994_008579 [Apiospora phragmitis]|uniref:Uncharacterized protein n=1 Tax=Apiospora phragmitis TaxID=2905665 RepID=A0ABR1UJ77_9PEZI